MHKIPEADWKKLRSLHETTLSKACAQILDTAGTILNNRAGREHDAYLELWRLLQEQNEMIARMFDDFRRSTAIFNLAGWYGRGLISDADLARFSEETQRMIKAFTDQKMG
jgi:hypothetical protein